MDVLFCAVRAPPIVSPRNTLNGTVDGTNSFLRYMAVLIWQREVFTKDRIKQKKGRKKALYTVPHAKMTYLGTLTYPTRLAVVPIAHSSLRPVTISSLDHWRPSPQRADPALLV